MVSEIPTHTRANVTARLSSTSVGTNDASQNIECFILIIFAQYDFTRRFVS